MPKEFIEIKLRDNNANARNTFHNFYVDLENIKNFCVEKYKQSNPAFPTEIIKKIGLALQAKHYPSKNTFVHAILDETKKDLTLLVEVKDSHTLEFITIPNDLNSKLNLAKIDLESSLSQPFLKSESVETVDLGIFLRNSQKIKSAALRIAKKIVQSSRAINQKVLAPEARNEALTLFPIYEAEIIKPLIKQQEQLTKLLQKLEANKQLRVELETAICNLRVVPDEEITASDKLNSIFPLEIEKDLHAQQESSLQTIKTTLSSDDGKNLSLIEQAELLLAENYSIYLSKDEAFKDIRNELINVLQDTVFQHFDYLLQYYKNNLTSDIKDLFNKKFKNIAEIVFETVRTSSQGPVSYQNIITPRLILKDLTLKNPTALASCIQNFINVSKNNQGMLFTAHELHTFKTNLHNNATLSQYCSYKPYNFTWTDKNIENINKCYSIIPDQLETKVSNNQDFLDAVNRDINVAVTRLANAKIKIEPIIQHVRSQAQILLEIKKLTQLDFDNLNNSVQNIIAEKNNLLSNIRSLSVLVEDADSTILLNENDFQKLENSMNNKIQPILGASHVIGELNKETQGTNSIKKADALRKSISDHLNPLTLNINFKKAKKILEYLTQEHASAKAKRDQLAREIEATRIAEERMEQERLAAEEAERIQSQRIVQEENLAKERIARELAAREQAELERREKEFLVIHFAKMIYCLLEQVDFWHDQVKYFGGDNLQNAKGEEISVPKRIKELHDVKDNYNLDNYAGAFNFINAAQEVIKKSGNGKKLCCFAVRKESTTIFYKLIEDWNPHAPINEKALTANFKKIHSGWDKVFDAFQIKPDYLEETDVESNLSTPSSLSRQSSSSSLMG